MERRTGYGARGRCHRSIIASLALAVLTSGCGASIGGARLVTRASEAKGAQARTTMAPVGGIPPHDQIRSLAERIADALAADNPPAAMNALDGMRAIGYDCDFRATFNGHAGFASVKKAKAEARKTAKERGAKDFAVATRTLAAGVLGVLVMDWCPRGSTPPVP